MAIAEEARSNAYYRVPRVLRTYGSHRRLPTGSDDEEDGEGEDDTEEDGEKEVQDISPDEESKFSGQEERYLPPHHRIGFAEHFYSFFAIVHLVDG